MARKMIVFLIVIILITWTFPINAGAVPSEEFLDMPGPGHWSGGALRAAAENGLLRGSDGRLNPGGNLLRAEMAAVINRAFGVVRKADMSPFTDVPEESWYYEEMAKAVEMETFYGDDTGRLRPDDQVTRQEAFVVLSRALRLSGGPANALNRFIDKDQVSGWAVDAIAALADKGYIKGTDGKLNPLSNITREEFAQLMYNMVAEYITEKGIYSKDIEGNVVIRSPGVTLKNMTVSGDLIIAEGVYDGSVGLDNVKVTGRVLVRGGSNGKVDIEGESNIAEIVVYNKHGVKINVGKDATVNRINIQSGNTTLNVFRTTLNISPGVKETVVNGQPVTGGQTITIKSPGGQETEAEEKEAGFTGGSGTTREEINKQLEQAINAVTNASYGQNISQKDYGNEDAIKNYLKSRAEAAIADSSITVKVNTIMYTPPVPGNSSNPDGTDGSYVFNITVSKGSYSKTSGQLRIVITAVRYVPGSEETTVTTIEDLYAVLERKDVNKIVVNGNIEIAREITFNKNALINEGYTLTIGNNARMVINASLEVKGTLINNGAITIYKGKELVVRPKGKLTNRGEIKSFGNLNIGVSDAFSSFGKEIFVSGETYTESKTSTGVSGGIFINDTNAVLINDGSMLVGYSSLFENNGRFVNNNIFYGSSNIKGDKSDVLAYKGNAYENKGVFKFTAMVSTEAGLRSAAANSYVTDISVMKTLNIVRSGGYPDPDEAEEQMTIDIKGTETLIINKNLSIGIILNSITNSSYPTVLRICSGANLTLKGYTYIRGKLVVTNGGTLNISDSVTIGKTESYGKETAGNLVNEGTVTVNTNGRVTNKGVIDVIDTFINNGRIINEGVINGIEKISGSGYIEPGSTK